MKSWEFRVFGQASNPRRHCVTTNLLYPLLVTIPHFGGQSKGERLLDSPAAQFSICDAIHASPSSRFACFTEAD